MKDRVATYITGITGITGQAEGTSAGTSVGKSGGASWVGWLRASWDAFGVVAVVWLVLGVGVGLWQLWHLPLQELDFQGLKRLNAEQVVHHAELNQHRGWLALGGHDLALRLLEHDAIARVNVWKPSAGRLQVHLYEREPSLRVLLAGGNWAVLDSERVVLSHTVVTKKGLEIRAVEGFERSELDKWEGQLSTVVGGAVGGAVGGEAGGVVGGVVSVQLGKPLVSDAVEQGLRVLWIAWQAGWPVEKPLLVDATRYYQVEVRDGTARLIFEASQIAEAFRTWLRVARTSPHLLEGHTMDLVGQERRQNQSFVLRLNEER